MPIVSTPPPVSGARKPATAKTVREAVKMTDKRAEAITGLGQLAQVPLIAMRQYADAGAIGVYWPNVAKEIATLAESQPAIAKIVDPLIDVGPYAALVTAILPMVLQIGVNHGRIQPGAMGTVPSVVLSAKVEAAIAHAELAALQEQAEMERESAEIRRQIEAQRREFAEASEAA